VLGVPGLIILFKDSVWTHLIKILVLGVKKKLKKKKIKKLNHEKKSIKSIKILKKPTGSFWFHFYKSETEKKTWKKTELNQKNRAKLKKPSQIDLNRFLSKKTEQNRNRSV
jgi:hypothetical protein